MEVFAVPLATAPLATAARGAVASHGVAQAAPQRHGRGAATGAKGWRPVAAAAGALAVAKGSQGLRSLRRRNTGSRGARGGAVLRCAVPTEKPTRTTLFTKAASDGVSLGDCPFSHAVQMALKIKGVDYDVVPCGPNDKPPWLLQEVGGQMPCVIHQGVPHVETTQILKWIDMTFPGPTLAVPEDYAQLVSRAGIFNAVAEYTKNTDSSKDEDLLVNLQMSLTRLRMHLFSLPNGTRYACGDALTLADCELLAALYVIQSATSSLKGWSLEELPAKDEVRDYYQRAAALPMFSQTCYSPSVAVQGWTMARQ